MDTPTPVTTPEVRAVEVWLTEVLPGGSYILPHWQDGPYWLVPLDASDRDTNWQVKLLLEAHTPLAERLPVCDGFDCVTYSVYAVSNFVYEMLRWHVEEGGLQVAEHCAGPFPQRPGAQDVINELPEWLSFDSQEYSGEREHVARVRTALSRVNASNLLTAIDAIAKYEENLQTPKAVLNMLTAASAVA